LGTRNVSICGAAALTRAVAAGRAGDETAVSFYGRGDNLRERVLDCARSVNRVVEGPEWPMTDHMVFAMRGVPAMAVTSTGLF
jgi:hypothetical protein